MDNYGFIGFTGVTEVDPFYTSILNGTKTSTIRKIRKDGRAHVKVGHTTKFYWKVRTPKKEKPIHYIGKAEILSYEKVHLIDIWDDEELAKMEGFASIYELRDWFLEGWWGMRLALDILTETHKKVVKEFGEDEATREVLRRVGEHSPIVQKFQVDEYYLIKWKYPLVEAGYAQGSLPDPLILDL